MESESGQAEHSGRLRLRLIWNNGWHRVVRVARDLASRIGPQVEGAPIPLAVGRQTWSPRMSRSCDPLLPSSLPTTTTWQVLEVAMWNVRRAVAQTSERWWDSETQVVGTVRHVQ